MSSKSSSCFANAAQSIIVIVIVFILVWWGFRELPGGGRGGDISAERLRARHRAGPVRAETQAQTQTTQTVRNTFNGLENVPIGLLSKFEHLLNKRLWRLPPAETVLPHPAQKRPSRGCCPWLACCAPPSRRRGPRPRSPGGPARARGSRGSTSASCRGTRARWTARATAAARPGTIRGSPAPSVEATPPVQRRTSSTVTPPCLLRCTLPRDRPPTPHQSAIRPRKVFNFSIPSYRQKMLKCENKTHLWKRKVSAESNTVNLLLVNSALCCHSGFHVQKTQSLSCHLLNITEWWILPIIPGSLNRKSCNK